MKIFFIGIKGSGMSALAQYLFYKGFDVCGSDLDSYFFTEDKLIDLDIKIYKYGEYSFLGNEIVIKGNSIESSNVDLVNCNNNTINYNDCINKYVTDNLICVAGTHGKTTTSTILSNLLNSNYIIGDGSGLYKGSFFTVLESCEYKDTFLSYKGKYGIITSIDYDHSDYFESIDDVYNSFYKFSLNMEDVIVYDGNINSNLSKYITFGFKSSSDYYIDIINENKDGFVFRLINNENIYILKTNLIGRYNLTNLVSCLVLLILEGYNINKINLMDLELPKRRLETTKKGSNVVVNDYAHHPTEINACLSALKQKYNMKLLVIFQPHTYSRTLEFYNDFIKSFEGLNLYLCNVFSSSRESKQDFDLIKFSTEMSNCKIFKGLSDLKHINNSVIVFMGAGNIDKLYNDYINN